VTASRSPAAELIDVQGSAEFGHWRDDPAVPHAAYCAVDRLVRAARRIHGGQLPVIGTPAWMTASWVGQAATVAILGEGWILRDPDQLAAEQLKTAATALASGLDWSTAAHSIVYCPHGVLAARRAEIGPLAREVDRAAAAEWARTGRAPGKGAPA